MTDNRLEYIKKKYREAETGTQWDREDFRVRAREYVGDLIAAAESLKAQLRKHASESTS